MAIYKKLGNLLITTVLMSSVAYGGGQYDNGHYYYEDEGKLLTKFKVFYSELKPKETTFTSSLASANSSKKLFSNAYGGEASVAYFFGANFAAELSAGVARLSLKPSEFDAVASAIGDNAANLDKNAALMIPVSATMQYHIAPYGAIRPYVGAGYGAAYLNAKSNKISLDGSSGFVLQAGVDFVTRNDHVFTLEVKKYSFRPKITLETPYLDPNNSVVGATSSKVKIDPIVVSLGFGFKL